jgi:hypothetical protein
MNRLIFIGKNSELPRDVCSRPASAFHPARTPSRVPVNCEAGPSFRRDAGVRDGRNPSPVRKHEPLSSPGPVSAPLRGQGFGLDVAFMLLAGIATVGFLTLVLL